MRLTQVAVILTVALSVCAAKQKVKGQEKRGLVTAGHTSSTPLYNGNDILDAGFAGGFGDVTTAAPVTITSKTPSKIAVTPTVSTNLSPSLSVTSSPLFPGFETTGLGLLGGDWNPALGFAGFTSLGGGASGTGAVAGSGIGVSSAPVRVTTISRPVPVPFPQPVEVTITRRIPVPVPYPVPVEVPRPVPVPVPQPYPVAVPKPYPVEVLKPVPHPVPHPVPVSVPHPYPVAVPHAFGVGLPVVSSVAPVVFSPELSSVGISGGFPVLKGFDGFEGFDTFGLTGGFGDSHLPLAAASGGNLKVHTSTARSVRKH